MPQPCVHPRAHSSHSPTRVGKSASKVWYDDADTLGPKFGLAGKHGLRGVGMFTVSDLPTEDNHADIRTAMWQAVKGWHAKA